MGNENHTMINVNIEWIALWIIYCLERMDDSMGLF